MNQLQAARETLQLARLHGMDYFPYHHDIDETIQYPHLKDMLRRMETMTDKSEAKLGRWLGWMQCAVVVMCANVTLDDMKKINIRNSKDHIVPDEDWEYRTTSYVDERRAEEAVLDGWEIDESIVSGGILVIPGSHVERHWKRKKA